MSICHTFFLFASDVQSSYSLNSGSGSFDITLLCQKLVIVNFYIGVSLQWNTEQKTILKFFE